MKCNATYPGMWQPTACTLPAGQHDHHVDERRSLRWAATTEKAGK